MPSTPKHPSHIKTYLSKHKTTMTLFIVFLALISLTMYFAFYQNLGSSQIQKSPLTGFITQSGTEEQKIQIKASLDIPNLKISTKTSEVKIITGTSNTILQAGSEKFDLSKVGESDITLVNFDGNIEFDSEYILNLNGKATETLINNIKTTSNSGDKTKIKISEIFSYRTLKIKDTSFRSLSYITSGEINLNGKKATFRLNEDNVDLTSFKGDITIEGNTFYIDGEVNKLKINGELNFDVNL